MNRKAHMACNFKCRFKTDGLLKVTASHVYFNCSNISEAVQDRVVVITDH